MSIFIVIGSVALFVLGYIFYGRYVARRLGIDASRETPAHTLRDGIDYEPAKKPVLLGHHFASIAGAAPIIGPITAAVFGWVPVLLWIVFGGIFIGAVHDFGSLVASVRHRGRSIGEVIEDEIGHTGKTMFLIFSWLTLVLVVAVFAVVVAKSFVSVPQAATASVLFLVVALVWGGVRKKNIAVATVIGIIFMAGALVAGMYFPVVLGHNTWLILIFIYVFFASVAPVGLLLRPRDYLNAYLLYAALLLGFVGIIYSMPHIQMPAFTGFVAPKLGPMFPILFVTVACGAISGFHSLVASGTVAKQLDKETDAKVIGFGAMLIESFLAVVALIAAITMTHSEYIKILGEGGPVAVFSKGIGAFVGKTGIPESGAVAFLALAVSAFALTSLDTATRIGRFMFQEFFSRRERKTLLGKNRYIATVATVAGAAILAFTGSYSAIWPIFGTANQLMAALALLTISVWLINRGKRPLFTLIPMVLMMAITLTALVTIMYTNFARTHNWLLGIIGLLLFAVAVFLVIYAWGRIRKTTKKLSG